MREKQLRDELMVLKFQSKDLDVIGNSFNRQDEIIAELDTMRKNEILPIYEELAAFISKRTKEIEKERKAKGEPFGPDEFNALMEEGGSELIKDEKFTELMMAFNEEEDED